LGKRGLTGIVPGLLVAAEAAGVYARTEIFERVISALSDFITRHREPNTEVLRFPPVMNRRQLELSGYLQSFPHLLGVVSCILGDESKVRHLVEEQDWVSALSTTELVLVPAACYPVYPLVAARGRLPNDGVRFDVESYCFRRELTDELGRLQSFLMREYVCIGLPEQVLDFRDRWISRAESMATQLGLPYLIKPASDPFFGRIGMLAARDQLEQNLKLELLIPLQSDADPTACMSFNYHRGHFGTAWGLHTINEVTAHSACVAFGVDRVALALFATHGVEVRQWPASVRDALALNLS
jgi:seryl-tRNA synthetase